MLFSRRKIAALGVLFASASIGIVVACGGSDPVTTPADSGVDSGGSFDSGIGVDTGLIDSGNVADSNVVITYCDLLDPKPTFCDSFDNSPTFPSPNAATWTILENHGSIKLAPDDAAPSSPNVAIAAALQCDAGNSCIGGLERVLGPAKDVDVTMSFRLDSWDAVSAIDIASLGFDINKPSGSGTIFLDVEEGLFVIASTVLDSTGMSFDGSQREKTGVKANLNTWYRVGIRSSLSTSPPTATFTINATPINLTLPAVYTQATAPTATLHVGITYVTGPSEPAQLRFDSVTAVVK